MKTKIKVILSSMLMTFAAGCLYAQSEQAQEALEKIDHRFFIENKGQWDDEVLYLTQMGGLDAWITRKGMLYDFYKLEEESNSIMAQALPGDKFEPKDQTRTGHRVWLKLQGQNKQVTTAGKYKQQGYYNYLIGNDPSQHATNVGLYKEASIKDVYEGIDMRYLFQSGTMRYDFIVAPYGNPSQINFTLEGSEVEWQNEKGELMFSTRFGEVAMAQLKVYEEGGKEVEAKFARTEKGWKFVLGDYDKSKTLIIDPLIYLTYLGGSNYDYGFGIALDASGNAFVTGQTWSTNYDTTAGAYQITYGGGIDAFVTKLGIGANSTNTVATSENSFENKLTVFPNPTLGKVTIDLGASYANMEITVINALGQEVMRKNFATAASVELNIAEESKVYFVKITTAEGYKATLRVVKQ